MLSLAVHIKIRQIAYTCTLVDCFLLFCLIGTLHYLLLDHVSGCLLHLQILGELQPNCCPPASGYPFLMLRRGYRRGDDFSDIAARRLLLATSPTTGPVVNVLHLEEHDLVFGPMYGPRLNLEHL